MGAFRRTVTAAASRLRTSTGATSSMMAATRAVSPNAFRPGQVNPLATASPAPRRETISGMWFCLNMVFFATPGLVFAKKLCDGQTPEDMVNIAKQHVDILSSKF